MQSWNLLQPSISYWLTKYTCTWDTHKKQSALHLHFSFVQYKIQPLAFHISRKVLPQPSFLVHWSLPTLPVPRQTSPIEEPVDLPKWWCVKGDRLPNRWIGWWSVCRLSSGRCQRHSHWVCCGNRDRRATPLSRWNIERSPCEMFMIIWILWLRSNKESQWRWQAARCE